MRYTVTTTRRLEEATMTSQHTTVILSVLWQQNELKGDNKVIGFFNKTAIFPSLLDMESPDPLGRKREEYPQVGQLETCALIINEKGNTYFAFPASSDYHCKQLPGVKEAVEISWIESAHKKGSVYGIIELEDSIQGLDVLVMPAKNWEADRPVAGSVTECKINWVNLNEKIIGFAYRNRELKTTSVGAIDIEGTDITLVCREHGYVVSVMRDESNGKIIIELKPDKEDQKQ